MRFYNINNNSNFKVLFDNINPHPYAFSMKDKANILLIYIKGISSVAANILKQDALSIGADLLTNKNAIFGGEERSNALLIISKSQAKKLIPKLKLQDFRLNRLADFLNKQLLSKSYTNPQIMGVINLTDNSFNPSSMANDKTIISKIEDFIQNGADIIDIGGASSKPNSVYIGEEYEFENIKNSIDLIYEHKLYEKIDFSLDSFNPKCVEYALDKGFKIVNDISANMSLISLVQKYNATYVLMHASNEYLSSFFGKNHFNEYAAFNGNILDKVYNFFKAHLEVIDYDKVILDIGIGFGKSMGENMLLIKQLSHFNSLNLPILVGASRKGMINHYHKSEVEQRLAGTLFLHLKAIENGANIIRVHDVYEHKQLLELLKGYNEVDNEL